MKAAILLNVALLPFWLKKRNHLSAALLLSYSERVSTGGARAADQSIRLTVQSGVGSTRSGSSYLFQPIMSLDSDSSSKLLKSFCKCFKSTLCVD